MTRRKTREWRKEGKPKNVKRLCEIDKSGTIPKSLITIDNYKELKGYVQSVTDIQLKSKKSFSYRQYCRLLESYMFKSKKCDGNVCCQAITGEGERCKRSSTFFVSIDLTEKQVTLKIPKFIRSRLIKKLGPGKVLDLELIGFANNCCFYCWQHAAMYALEGSTYTSNLLYYSTHPEALLMIFFEHVKVKKLARLFTYSVDVSKPRSVSEIVKYIYKTTGDMQGALSLYYWGVFITIFAYDTIKPMLLSYLEMDKEKAEETVDKMALKAGEALVEFND